MSKGTMTIYGQVLLSEALLKRMTKAELIEYVLGLQDSYRISEECRELGAREAERLLKERSNERSKRCKGCEYARDRHAQDGWHYHGCFHKPYNGKWIAEIENCPKERSKE